MKVISQVEAQRKILEEAVSTALELASGKSDGAEVAVSKTTGISVSTRYGEVENVEFNSDGALGITVYHQNRKGSASSTDLSPQAIARTVDYFRSLGMPTCLTELGCGLQSEEELKELARRCTFYGARTIGAFRVLGEADILAIYRAANR